MYIVVESWDKMDKRLEQHAELCPVDLKFLLKKSSSSLSELMNPVGPSTATPLPSQEEDEMLGPTRAIRKEEFVRVITKALYALGCGESGAALEEESDIYLYSPMVCHFWNQMLNRNWDESVAALHNIDILDENTVKAASFLIYGHKFFELLESNKDLDALNTLRTEISSLSINTHRVCELSNRLVFPEHETANSAKNLKEELQKFFPPTVMIPERRLEHLVEQAINIQKEACYFHNSLDTISLNMDYQCDIDQVPSKTIQILQAHKDEVWVVKFSNNGKYLASSSKDKFAIVWEVREDGNLSVKHTLTGHNKPVVMVAWRPDDRQLLTCGFEEVIRCWDVSTGECLRVYQKAVSTLYLVGGSEMEYVFFLVQQIRPSAFGLRMAEYGRSGELNCCTPGPWIWL